MTASTVNGLNGCGARAGARTLNVLAAPLNCQILQALHDGPKQQADLRREAGHPTETTLRAHLKRLSDAGAIERRRLNRFPGTLEYGPTPAGHDLLEVAETLEAWLAGAPRRPPRPDTCAARKAVKALAEGWSAGAVGGLARGLLTLGELARQRGAPSYSTLEHRLALMRDAELVVPCRETAGDTRNTVGGRLRAAAAPLLAAASCEDRHGFPGVAPLRGPDLEAIFLLALPGLRLGPALAGCCLFAAWTPNDEGPASSGVKAIGPVDGGAVSISTDPRDSPDAWASGSARAWCRALTEGCPDELVLGGRRELALALLGRLRDELFAHRPPSASPSSPSWRSPSSPAPSSSAASGT